MFKIGDKVKRKSDTQASLFWYHACNSSGRSQDDVFIVSGVNVGENELRLTGIPSDWFCASHFESYTESESSDFTEEDEALLQNLIQRKSEHESKMNLKKSLNETGE
jgi:hypothetical protein